MPDHLKRTVITLIKFAVPIAIIGYLLQRIEPQQWDDLTARSINTPLLLGALCVAICALLVSFVRWWVLVRCQGIPLSLLEAMRLSSICFLLSFVSAGSVGGDLFKAIFLAKRSPGKRVAAVASVVVDRGSGLYGLLLLVSGGLLLHQSQDPFEFNGITIDDIKLITVGLLSVGSAILAVLVFGGKFVDTMMQRIEKWPVVGPVFEHVGPPLRMFHHHPWAFAASILMSVVVQGLLVISMYLIAVSMYDLPPTLAEHFVIVPIGMLMSALPLTPAGIGVLEATIETLYHIIPARTTDASGTLVALAFELVKVVMAVIGTVFYWTAGREVQESLEEANTADSNADDLDTTDSATKEAIA
ncbi:lysylphosphatidylglycerol synthase transmembrane domain-containing protein [Rhodopirellula halodulae]|uniref:lysylphosphatidylglycerol synthase transmembrane domain-containing protein n=1 Tax=Rhodopirellula halodulae TaxID=2894198 RepID=UPI001E2BBFE9|nr:lysylphosphatidylglycerol synthase transmembrane domain-containing protein [Rhodopirellula sp. JC737]MCC9657677.1 flippase-like domain-containing protein [Rhodopirellula sp. JC737]